MKSTPVRAKARVKASYSRCHVPTPAPTRTPEMPALRNPVRREVTTRTLFAVEFIGRPVWSASVSGSMTTDR